MNSTYTEQMMRGDSERSLAARRSRRHKEIERDYHTMMQEKKQRLVSIATAASMLWLPLLAVATTQHYA